MNIIAYTYEADIHCPSCAELRFDREELAHGLATDHEGNEVHPVFSTDEIQEDTVCGDCGAKIE